MLVGVFYMDSCVGHDSLEVSEMPDLKMLPDLFAPHMKCRGALKSGLYDFMVGGVADDDLFAYARCRLTMSQEAALVQASRARSICRRCLAGRIADAAGKPIEIRWYKLPPDQYEFYGEGERVSGLVQGLRAFDWTLLE